MSEEARDLLAELYLSQPEIERLYPSGERCPDQCGGRVGHSGPHQSSDYVPREIIEAHVRADIAATVVRLLKADSTPGDWNAAIQVALYVIRGDA